MYVGHDVFAKQSEERRDSEGFVAVTDQLVVDCFFVEIDAEEGGYRIDRDHKQNSNNAE